LQKVGGGVERKGFFEKMWVWGQIKALFGKNVVMGVTQPAVEPGTPPPPREGLKIPFYPKIWYILQSTHYILWF